MGHVEKQRKEHFLSLLDGSARVTPECPHVAEGCGGCLLQEYEYKDQCKAKEKLLSEVYGQTVEIVPSPSPLGYRNRMDFVTAFGKTGLRRRAKFAQVVDVKECFLLPDHARDMYTIARNIIAASGLQEYNYIRHEGFLRYITIRTSQLTKETMIIFTTKMPIDAGERARVQGIFSSVFEKTGATSLHWTVNDGKADMSIGEQFWHAGTEHIIDELAGKRFRILPWTFFQANTMLASELFKEATSYAHGDMLDMCCGVGVISILAAGQSGVSSVLGVDIVEQSIAIAKENALLNNGSLIVQPEFVCADMNDFIAHNTKSFDTVICDPNRPGLGKNVCEALLRMAPKRIIYISCNPLSQKEDLAMLNKQYEMTLLRGYDLFPQTPHIEALSVLERRIDETEKET